jgi:hypothetical protein
MSQEQTREQMLAEIARLKTAMGKKLAMKVSEKGGVSVYGLGHFPCTLYKEQWIRILNAADEIRAFIADHEAELKTKAPKAA